MTPETEASNKQALMSFQGVSLYQLERELVELMDLRESAESDEEKAAADTQIALWVEEEVSKVDGIMAYMRHCIAMSEGAFKEAERLAALGRRWAKRNERLERATLNAMLTFGASRIEGKLGHFAVRQNPPSVEIHNESLLPMEFKTATVTLAAEQFQMLTDFLSKFETVVNTLAPDLNFANAKASLTPRKGDIAKVLKQRRQCGDCMGTGRIVFPDGVVIACKPCLGEGFIKGHVAGASLVADKVRLEVK